MKKESMSMGLKALVSLEEDISLMDKVLEAKRKKKDYIDNLGFFKVIKNLFVRDEVLAELNRDINIAIENHRKHREETKKFFGGELDGLE